jgi:hypothetical protein
VAGWAAGQGPGLGGAPVAVQPGHGAGDGAGDGHERRGGDQGTAAHLPPVRGAARSQSLGA